MTDHTSNREAPWLWRGIALAVLGVGWLFIAWTNHFRFSAPVVFVCLGFFAIVATVYNLWRTGAVAVMDADDIEDADSTWAKPAGATGELEREKRTLLKAIKEAEFDHEMGKLSKRDADEMIAGYRARAIEVFKDLERLEQGAASTVREQIMREVRARLELEAKSSKKPGKPSKANGAAEPAKQDRTPAATDPKAELTATAPSPAVAAALEPAATDAADAAEPARSDDELDADSTTALDPVHETSAKPAKEATP